MPKIIKNIRNYCNFTYSLLGIETTAINSSINDIIGDCNFTYSLLGIETKYFDIANFKAENCNFTYSLLGIETFN